MKNVVDKGEEIGYNSQADSESWGAKPKKAREGSRSLQEQKAGKEAEDRAKKTLKNFEKSIDKGKWFWYNNKAAPQEVREAPWKLNNNDKM